MAFNSAGLNQRLIALGESSLKPGLTFSLASAGIFGVRQSFWALQTVDAEHLLR